jgi:hypothetical protein
MTNYGFSCGSWSENILAILLSNETKQQPVQSAGNFTLSQVFRIGANTLERII